MRYVAESAARRSGVGERRRDLQRAATARGGAARSSSSAGISTAMRTWLELLPLSEDPLFLTVIDRATGDPSAS